MNRRVLLKRIHIVSTAWFVLCAGLLLVMAFARAGFNWWMIFSLSGYSALFLFLLISLYLFAIFGAAGKGHKIAVEHPLTSTAAYLVFYVTAPLLGALAGAAGVMGQARFAQFIPAVALGTLGTTFITWIIVDPLVLLLEMLSPSSRLHRARRLALDKLERDSRQQQREQRVARVLARHEEQARRWQQELMPQAELLASLLTADRAALASAEKQAVDIGVMAWRTGGIKCMRQLRNMAIEKSRALSENSEVVDYISAWWDGIGSWRSSVTC